MNVNSINWIIWSTAATTVIFCKNVGKLPLLGWVWSQRDLIINGVSLIWCPSFAEFSFSTRPSVAIGQAKYKYPSDWSIPSFCNSIFNFGTQLKNAQVSFWRNPMSIDRSCAFVCGSGCYHFPISINKPFLIRKIVTHHLAIIAFLIGYLKIQMSQNFPITLRAWNVFH